MLAALALIVSSIMSRQCALLATLSVEEAVQLVAIQLPVVLASVVTLSDLTEAVAAALVGPAQGRGPGGRLDRTRAWWKEFVEDPERCGLNSWRRQQHAGVLPPSNGGRDGGPALTQQLVYANGVKRGRHLPGDLELGSLVVCPLQEEQRSTANT